MPIFTEADPRQHYYADNGYCVQDIDRRMSLLASETYAADDKVMYSHRNVARPSDTVNPTKHNSKASVRPLLDSLLYCLSNRVVPLEATLGELSIHTIALRLARCWLAYDAQF